MLQSLSGKYKTSTSETNISRVDEVLNLNDAPWNYVPTNGKAIWKSYFCLACLKW